MLTDEVLGIEYEPNQGKWAQIAPKIMVLVSDNLTVHTDILYNVKKTTGNNVSISVENAANCTQSI